MADRSSAVSIEELPEHLILEILASGRLAAADLACLETTSRMFRGSHLRGFRTMAESAAFHVCGVNSVFGMMPVSARRDLADRCGGSWKKVLRFLQAVERSSGTVETSAGNMQITTGRYHTLLIHDWTVYSCGSSICGVLGHGQDTTQCVAFSPISFPSLSRVTHISASHNHAAFVMQSGEVTVVKMDMNYSPPLGMLNYSGIGHVVQIAAGTSYTFAVIGDGTVHSFGSCSNFCLGHGDQHDELLPRAIQSFKRRNSHVVRVSAGDEHAVALDSSGYVYTWGRGYCGALGHGDENDKTIPVLLTTLKDYRAAQVCARKRKTFVLTDEGSVFAFGWMGFGSLGFSDHGNSDKIMKPRILECLRSHNVCQISTGLYHTVAVTNRGNVFGFGDNERAQLGHEWLRGCLKPTEIRLETMVNNLTIQAQSA